MYLVIDLKTKEAKNGEVKLINFYFLFQFNFLNNACTHI